MDVAVKINGTTYTSHVISYQREHKICSSVGTLDITLDGEYTGPTSPWTTVDIWENGDFKVRYYVSQTTQTAPGGTIQMECQDISKRLVDYFIPDSYTIDYPSYTRTWIEQFLTEAGIDVEFTVAGSGNLLSNYTALGLQSGYDQIMMLLQLSGWYMYFDGNGKAIIGSLDVNLADPAGKVNKTDILNIKKVTNDKMLRNRAVVWGQYDVIRGEYAYADVSVKTPFNYDSRDQRAIVISNNNIPNKSSAFNIANILIKEFAKATIEKHITLWGARDMNLGEALNVSSSIWRGKGLITTFGTSMDRNGLVTNLILDERCPRLFGFFNFGDWVYVGTFGSGIWRKHIKFDPAWYNFSTGLTDLNITDLHINQDIFGAVASSGQMYYANSNEGPWNPISITSLTSSTDDTASGVVTYVEFSGIMGRATIVDRQNNIVKYGVDNSDRMNTGDYFLTYSGLMNPGSGIVTTSGNRGWIVDYDPFTGLPTGGLGSGIYPIVYSGSYNIQVLDLENDGLNDYVSVSTGGTPGPTVTGIDSNFGHWYTQGFASTRDYNSFTIFPDTQSITDINNEVRGSMETTSIRVQNPNAMIAIDDQISGYTYAVAVGADKVARKDTFTRTFSAGAWNVTRTEVVSSAQSAIGTVIGIYPTNLGAATFRVYHYAVDSPTTPTTISFRYIDWNSVANTWGTNTLIATETLPGSGTGLATRAPRFDVLAINNKIYLLLTYIRSLGNTFNYPSASHLYINVATVNMETATEVFNAIIDYTTEQVNTNYYYFNQTNLADNTGFPASVTSAAGNSPYFKIFQNGTGVQILGRVELFKNDFGINDFEYATKEILFAGNDTVIQSNEIYEDIQTQNPYTGIRRFQNSFEGNWTQLTATNAIIVGYGTTSGNNAYAWDGTAFFTFTSTGNSTTIPYYFKRSTVFPMFANNENKYIAINGSTFYVCSADSLSTVVQIVPPANVYPAGFCSTGFGSFGASVMSRVFIDDVDGFDWLVPFDFTSFDLGRKLYTQDDGFNASPSMSTRNINFGNFFIADSSDYTAVQPVAGLAYVDLGTPDWVAASYMVLQREGLEYNLIQESAKPIRIDISNNSPVLTVLDMESTFISNFVYGQSLEVVTPLTLSTTSEVRDYRYTMLETTTSGTIVASGAGVQNQIVYANPSGIFYANAENYSGGFLLLDTVPSGMAERIETTNYTYPGQFLFVTTSGNNPAFFQKDNDGLAFTSYSGLPASRATIIRCDDII